MAARLEISNAWLSRYLDLARLPAGIVRAYGDLGELREFHARRLKPLLAEPVARMAVLRAAEELADRQAALKAAGTPHLAGAKVLSALLAAGRPPAGAAADEPVLTSAWTGPDARIRGTCRGRQVTLVVEGPGGLDQVALDRLVGWLGERMQAGRD
jgi:ParB family chromosome partitioning protein